MVVAAVVVAGAGAVAWVARPASEGERSVARWAAAWAQGDYAALIAELSPAARERFGRREVARAHRHAKATATLRALEPSA